MIPKPTISKMIAIAPAWAIGTLPEAKGLFFWTGGHDHAQDPYNRSGYK